MFTKEKNFYDYFIMIGKEILINKEHKICIRAGLL